VTEINGVTHVPRVVFYYAATHPSEVRDERLHIAYRTDGQLICGRERDLAVPPTPGGEVCSDCEREHEALSVLRGEYPRDTLAEEVPAP
jgi:hypothetical protein